MMRSITGKVSLGVAIFLAFLALIAFQALQGIAITSEAVGHLAHNALPQAALSEQFEIELVRGAASLALALDRRAPADLAGAREQAALARQVIVALAPLELDETDPQLLALADRRRELLARFEALLADADRQLADSGRPALDAQIAALDQIAADLDRMIAERTAALGASIGASAAEAEAPVRAARVAAPIGFSLIGLVALLVIWLLHRLIVWPVRSLAAVATAIGARRLDRPIDTSGVDEIGDLQRALAQMMASLREHEQALLERAEQIVEHQRVEIELTRARDVAEAANQAKSAFLSVMSHELRTPLTAIIGYSQLIEQQAAEGDYHTVVADLRQIHSAGQHLLSLINDVLDLTRIEAGKLQIIAEPVDVCALVDTIAATVAPLVRQRDNMLEVDCQPQIALISTDPLKLRQALLNLLGNAAKFTEAGLIRLTVREEQRGGARWVTFAVADSGIGIAADQMPKLFQPFSQVDDSLSRTYGGTGLGLALSRRLCQLLGGDISVESSFGVGSTFTICIPAVAPEAPVALLALGQEPATVSSPAPPAPTVSEHMVLVIDDDPAVGGLIGRMIGPERACVIHAAGGAEGVDLARDVLPDLIFLDVLMPGMDGWEVLRQLKADPALAPIPVVMISIDDQRQRGIALGMADFITKPFQPAAFAASLRWLSSPTPPADYILVVDSDPMLADAMAGALGDAGWRCVTAHAGSEALSAIAARPPAAIVLDLLLPDMDGVELAATLQARPSLSACPVILIADDDLGPSGRARIQGSLDQVLRRGDDTLDALARQVQACLDTHIAQPASGLPN